MRDRIRFWLKMSAAMVAGVVAFSALVAGPIDEGLVLGFKTMALDAFGTQAQRDQLVESIRRRDALRKGTYEEYLRDNAVEAASVALRRLAELDPAWADYVLESALSDRAERRQGGAADCAFAPGEER